MKSTSLSLLAASLFAFQLSIAQPGPLPSGTTATMKLLSPYFGFNAKNPPQSVLTKSNAKSSFSAGAIRDSGFTIRMRVNLQKFQQEQKILEIPGILFLQLRQANPAIRDQQNYPAYPMPDGSVPVLEAGITLTAPVEKPFKRQMDIGFPIAALKHPWGEHEVVLHFTGVRWTMYVDSLVMDNNFPIGYPRFDDENEWEIDPGFVSQASISFPAIRAQRDISRQNNQTPNVQYWTPQGHNAWVGDVATLYYKGRYHVFYLFDRRHHASKFGVGGHYFEHFSTTDFRTWTEHEAAVPIDEQWETIGTGTPFVFDNKLCIAYGMHTSRIYPKEMTMTPLQKSFYEQHGKTGSFPFDLSKGYPSGASYSVSQNGVDDFSKSKRLFHFSENPSVYTDPEGKLKMIANFGAKGIWASETLDSNWHNINPDFPPGGDCTFYFRWGKFDYIIGGFGQLYSKPVTAGDKGWVDMVKDGRDFYNGIDVPAITKIKDDRFLMAGWFPIRHGWGGPFVIHELIQQFDGRIRSKWMKEMIPATRDTVILATRVDKAISFPVKDQSFILSFDVYPAKSGSGKLAVSFLDSGKNEYANSCEWQIRPGESRAQYSAASKDSFAGTEQSLRQGGEPHAVGNYAIENLTGINKPFTVRLLVKNTAKLGGSVFDTEIAGQNTMISYRQDLVVKTISFNLQEIEVRNIKIMSIGENN